MYTFSFVFQKFNKLDPFNARASYTAYFFSSSAISHSTVVTPREQRVNSTYLHMHIAYVNTMELVMDVFVGYLNGNIWMNTPLQRGERTRKTLPHKTQGIFKMIL